MSLFRPERRADHPTSDLGELYDRRRTPSLAGVPVDPDSALRMSAVWACVDLIATNTSVLPLDEYRSRPDGTREELPTPPLFDSPDGELGLTGWLYQVVESLLKRGNAYGLILRRDRDGWPTKIQMLPPQVVQVEQRGEPFGPYEWKLEGHPIRRYDARSGHGDLWHVPAYLTAGSPVGLSPIAKAALSIGTGLAAQEFGARWFRDNATPAAILSNEKTVNKETAKLVKRRWVEALRGNREPVTLGDGWKYEAVQVPANESQFLETIRASTVDVARYFRVPPSEIGASLEGSSQTYANQEQRALALLTYTLNPWLVRLEEALTGLRPRDRFMKFNVDALLRTDLETRYRAHELSIVSGWKNVDEVRSLEDLPPLPGGDGERHLWPPRRQQLTEQELATGADEGSGDGVATTATSPATSGGGEGPSGVLDITRALQQVYLAVVNGVVTQAEARAIVNRLGAGLSLELPPELKAALSAPAPGDTLGSDEPEEGGTDG